MYSWLVDMRSAAQRVHVLLRNAGYQQWESGGAFKLRATPRVAGSWSRALPGSEENVSTI